MIEKSAQKSLSDMKTLLQEFLTWEEQGRVQNPEHPLPELGEYLLQKQNMIARIQALLQTNDLAALFREDFFKQYRQDGFSQAFLTLRQEVRQLFVTIGTVLAESIQQLDEHKAALRKELESLQTIRRYVQNCRATLLPARQMEFSE